MGWRAYVLGVLAVLAVLLGAAPSALAVTQVTCAELPALFGTATGAAFTGEVAQLPAGPCQVNITATNTKAFTLEGTSPGTVLEPAAVAQPIIANGTNNVEFTLTGLTFTGTNGASALSVTATGTPITLTDDTFTDDVGATEGGGAYIAGTSTEATKIADNTFSGDSAAFGGGGLLLAGPGAFTVTGNTFTGNSQTLPVTGSGGGALSIFGQSSSSNTTVLVADNTFGGSAASDGNTSAANGAGALIDLGTGQALTLVGNTFEGNSVAGTATATGPREGGGLWLGLSAGASTYDATQASNTFLDNTISETEVSPPPSNPLPAGGGGEWVSGVDVQSSGDRFEGNRVAVNDGRAPEGGGLGVFAATAAGSTPAQPAAFVGRDDLFTGNSTAAGGWGGAGYVGVILSGDCTGSCPGSTLTLEDSTIVNNSVDAGPASEGGALWGSPSDTLGLANSILYGNTPQPEIYGFGTISLQYSDVCTETGGPAVPSSAGDICANPELNADDTETMASPTVDAGSNAVVPAGLVTDLDGNARILASRETCAGLGPPVVDMGAFEATFTMPIPPCPPAPSLTPILGTTNPTVSGFSQSASKWLEGNALASITRATKKLPVGTTFKFTLSEAATVTLTFEHQAKGRKVGKKCVAVTKHNARKRRCSRTLTAGSIKLAGVAGANRVRFYGRLSKHAKLKPGTYTVVITATAASRTSSSHSLKFTIAAEGKR